jgi:hypothetical protein
MRSYARTASRPVHCLWHDDIRVALRGPIHGRRREPWCHRKSTRGRCSTFESANRCRPEPRRAYGQTRAQQAFGMRCWTQFES